MQVNKPLVLTGFMGSGKSTVGRMLSHRLHIPFLDLDHEIEQGENISIPEIFENSGESHFRDLEHRYLSEIMKGSPVVLSLGGGALTVDRNVEIIRQNSLLIYLKVPAEGLFQRLKNDTHRPLLRGEDGRQLKEPELRLRIESLLEEREKIYSQADLTVQVRPQWNILKTTNEVIRILSDYASAART